MLIEYKNIDVYQEEQLVLQDVCLNIDEGEFVYITGKVGSGKSSLVKTFYGELPVQKGTAQVLDFNMSKLKKKHFPDLRKKIGVIFQDFQLLTDRTVEDNLKFVLKATGWKGKTKIEDRIKEVLALVGMETKYYKMPHELSGGEQQRIAIARAILNHPKLILADEPTGNLDAETSQQITKLLHDVCQDGSAVVMITHNLSLLETFPGRVLQCKDHTLYEMNEPQLEKTDEDKLDDTTSVE